MKAQDLVDSFWTRIAMGDGIKGHGKKGRLPISRNQARMILDAAFLTIGEALEEGQEVPIPRFGKFTVKQYPEGSTIRIPQTGAVVPRSADKMKQVKFKPSKVLNQRVNLSSVEQD